MQPLCQTDLITVKGIRGRGPASPDQPQGFVPQLFGFKHVPVFV
jgi:hypothetical protein